MKDVIAAIIQKAINRYILLDPESKMRLRALQGNVVTVEFLKIGFIFQLIFLDETIQLKCDDFVKANVHIKGTPLTMAHMILTRGDRKHFFADDVSMEGNLEIGQQILDLFDQLEIDWEEYLSHWVGDVSAHQIGRFVKRVRTLQQRTYDTLLQNVNEFAHEEIDMFPSPEALKDFFNDVDLLRMDVDRMEARIRKVIKELK